MSLSNSSLASSLTSNEAQARSTRMPQTAGYMRYVYMVFVTCAFQDPMEPEMDPVILCDIFQDKKYKVQSG